MPVPVVATREAAVALLTEIGERRAQIRQDEEKLRDDTKGALRASAGLVSRAQAARLTGLNRSTIYELYLDGGDEDDGSANGGPGAGD
jgi:hypothetical protein